MDFLDKQLEDYIAEHTAGEPPLLQKLNRETHAKVNLPRMLSGHVQGRILSMLSHMIRPAAILEIGTYTGYSAICLAEGLQGKGTITTIDINEELEDMARRYFAEAGLTDSINYLIGDAMEVIPALNAGFDLVFIDADKRNYLAYYQLVLPKVNVGGFIFVDNVLWSGKVADAAAMDKDTTAIKHFNDEVLADERVETVLLPIRDGLTILRKK